MLLCPVVAGFERLDCSDQGMFLAEFDSQVNVNWVFVEDGFLDGCCSSRLTFSLPLDDGYERFAAFAIAADMMPWSVPPSGTEPKRLFSHISTRLVTTLAHHLPP